MELIYIKAIAKEFHLNHGNHSIHLCCYYCQVVTDNEFFSYSTVVFYFHFQQALAQSHHFLLETSSLLSLVPITFQMFLFNQLSLITLLISPLRILRSGVPLYLSLDFAFSFPRISAQEVSFSLMVSFTEDLKSLDPNSSCNNFSFPLKLINFYFLLQPTVGILVT